MVMANNDCIGIGGGGGGFATHDFKKHNFCILVQQFRPILKSALLDIFNLSFSPNKSFIL
jgi:hypothetical protein